MKKLLLILIIGIICTNISGCGNKETTIQSENSTITDIVEETLIEDNNASYYKDFDFNVEDETIFISKDEENTEIITNNEEPIVEEVIIVPNSPVIPQIEVYHSEYDDVFEIDNNYPVGQNLVNETKRNFDRLPKNIKDIARLREFKIILTSKTDWTEYGYDFEIAGLTAFEKNKIFIVNPYSYAIFHEMGHLSNSYFRQLSNTTEWIEISERERIAFKTFTNTNDHNMSSYQEYLAEAFGYYFLNREGLRVNCPRIYKFLTYYMDETFYIDMNLRNTTTNNYISKIYIEDYVTEIKSGSFEYWHKIDTIYYKGEIYHSIKELPIYEDNIRKEKIINESN